MIRMLFCVAALSVCHLLAVMVALQAQADTPYEFVVTAGQPSGCADMEAVAYAPFAAMNACAATVPLRMEFAAGATNCAEVVFGVDGTGDGILSPGEERLLVGWDCGEWKLVDCRTQEEATAPGEIGEARRNPAATGGVRRSRTWDKKSCPTCGDALARFGSGSLNIYSEAYTGPF